MGGPLHTAHVGHDAPAARATFAAHAVGAFHPLPAGYARHVARIRRRALALPLFYSWTAFSAVAGEPPAAPQAAITSPSSATSPNDVDRAAALASTREGNRLLDARRPEEALAKFDEAYRLVGGDKLRYNFAQAMRAIPGREADAYIEFETFLARVPNPAPEIAKAANAERDALRSVLGLLVVRATPAQAVVNVNGRAARSAPLSQAIPLKPGRHQVRVEQVGYRAVDAWVTIAAGQRITEDFALQSLGAAPVAVLPTVPGPTVGTAPSAARVPPAVAVYPAAPASAVPAGLAPTATVSATAREGDGKGGVFHRWWFWAAVGGAAAIAVTAIVIARGGDSTTFICPAGVEQCESVP